MIVKCVLDIEDIIIPAGSILINAMGTSAVDLTDGYSYTHSVSQYHMQHSVVILGYIDVEGISVY